MPLDDKSNHEIRIAGIRAKLSEMRKDWDFAGLTDDDIRSAIGADGTIDLAKLDEFASICKQARIDRKKIS